jgi:glycosyltransferase involved in cell wall biosynthesis
MKQRSSSHNTRLKPGFGFLLPWSFDYQGGVTNAVFGLAMQCLADDKYRPIALESDWNAPSHVEDEWCGITRVRLQLRAPWSKDRPLKIALSYLAHLPIDLYRIRRLTKRYNLVLINRQFPGLDSFNFILLRQLGLFRGKNILTFQGSDVRAVLSAQGWMRRMWRLLLRGSDQLIFVSEGLKEEFLSFDPTLASRAVVVHNGVDVESFLRGVDQPVPSPAFFKDDYQVVLSIGSFEYRKGHDLLVRAFEAVVRERKDTRLVIAGRSGPTLDAIRELIAERGLGTQIALLIDIPYDRMPALVRRADVFVLSSRWRKGQFGEGFPLVLAESGSLAKPVVSTRSTGCDEIILDGETGRLVELESAPELARAILDQLNDRENARRMGINLQKLVTERFTWKKAWHKYRELLDVT